jgi:hypothetical protein
MTTLKDLHFFSGHPAQFWPAFLTFTGQQLNAERTILLSRQADGWKQLLVLPTLKQSTIGSQPPQALVQLADRCQAEGQALLSSKSGKGFFVAQKLLEQDEQTAKVMIVQLPDPDASQVDSQRQQLSLLADVPLIYQRERKRNGEQQQRADFAQIL